MLSSNPKMTAFNVHWAGVIGIHTVYGLLYRNTVNIQMCYRYTETLLIFRCAIVIQKHG